MKEKKINKLCATCLNSCKQGADIILLGCKEYRFKPKQLEFKFSFEAKKKTKKNADYNR